jgi:hypothetical protein
VSILGLLVILAILAVALWVALAVIRGITTGAAPSVWLPTVVIGIVIIVAILLIAQAFGIPTPSLK